MFKRHSYSIMMSVAIVITFLTLLAILDLTFQEKNIPAEIYVILASSTGVIFGGRFLNPPNGK